MDTAAIITRDPEILGGTPVFAGTRVPVQSLLWHLRDGISLDAFLDDFPSVQREQAVALLDLATGSQPTPAKSRVAASGSSTGTKKSAG